MMTPIEIYPMFATCVALFVYLWTFARCGMARQKHKIIAPAITGAPEFERAYRVQANTVENLVWFLPSLWLFSIIVNPFWGGILGLVWSAGRVAYTLGYSQEDTAKRGPGFAIGFFTAAILLVGAFIKILWVMLIGAAS